MHDPRRGMPRYLVIASNDTNAVNARTSLQLTRVGGRCKICSTTFCTLMLDDRSKCVINLVRHLSKFVFNSSVRTGYTEYASHVSIYAYGSVVICVISARAARVFSLFQATQWANCSKSRRQTGRLTCRSLLTLTSDSTSPSPCSSLSWRTRWAGTHPTRTSTRSARE